MHIKQPTNLRHLLDWNTITDCKPHCKNRVANINVKYANAPTLQLKFALIKIYSEYESAKEVYLIQRKKFNYLTKIWKLQIPI